MGGRSLGTRRAAASVAVRMAVGVVTSVEDVAGAPEALVRARGVVPLLTFEPALANGVPVPGVFLQGFRFREVAGG